TVAVNPLLEPVVADFGIVGQDAGLGQVAEHPLLRIARRHLIDAGGRGVSDRTRQLLLVGRERFHRPAETGRVLRPAKEFLAELARPGRTAFSASAHGTVHRGAVLASAALLEP